nr:putative ribonuclease H-like domain-containing protein [Tanacetum cinerariifolium]
MAFVSSSSNNSNSSNDVNIAQGVNTANGVYTASSQVNAASSLNIDNHIDAVICASLSSQPNSTHLVNEDLEQIHPDNLEEMDLKWKMAMLTIRVRRFLNNTGRKLNLNGNDSVAFDKTKVECYNCHKRGHFARECGAQRGQDNRSRDVTRRTVLVETLNSSALVSCDGLGGYDWSDQAEEGPTNYALMAYSTSSASSLDYEVSDVEEEKVEKKEVKPSINWINFVKATTDNNPREIVKNGEQPKKTLIVKEVKKVNTAKPKAGVNAAKAKAKYNAVKGNKGNAVKASACRIMRKLMGDMLPLEEILKEGRLQTKNNVLFTDTECIVLSPDFKLIDENQILLRVPRQNNMYIIDLKNIVPTGGLTCLFAKAIENESKHWHRRLRHLNFKTINKLVKGNLVRGLPSKTFENDQSCVACYKRKQYRASCKTKVENLINKTLHLLHMDLFGPTFVKSLNKKTYCLVITDDYSRFTWVFFLGTNDETNGTLKSFITRLENLMNLRAKVIRCDNGTKFKNKEINQFCKVKGIMTQHSVARTPKQNRVAKRRNRKFIEAARTRLADSKMPTTFWAEAVNTACYVQNKVLVTKPYNKTLYEVFHGITPVISFLRPFGCPVTILNTIDHIGKFDRKVDEGFFVGYSLNKADFHNLDSTFQVSHIPTIRIHKDHPLKQVIKDLHSVPPTRRMTKNLEEHGLVGTVIPRTDHKDLQNCLFACFLSQLEPKKEQGKVSSSGNTQEEGIDYDEVFVPVARIEAIRLFLAYASFKEFIVYQMDVKSAFLYGKIEEEVYVFQPPRFEDLDFLDKEMCDAFEVLMHEKFRMSSMDELTFFLGLQVKQKKEGIFISQDKYVAEILKKFRFLDVKKASTPMETSKPLPKDKNREKVDVRMYRSMIGSLIYLKGQPKLGLWYPKDSPFDLVAYTESDYVGTVVANSTIEAEYVVASSCCGQVLWIQK